ncbi:hypothetical protein BC940DRAFT_237901 [Gongronella butleri]|nr:hypothetical protein BC940DRAFT_237901 [Gongronella butleri]
MSPTKKNDPATKKHRGTKRADVAEKQESRSPPRKKEKTESGAGVEDTSKKATMLEEGHIYFFYRPKVDTDEVQSADDVQRAYMLLKPYWSAGVKRVPTLIILGSKKLPSPSPRSRHWGFVASASENMDEVVGAFKEHTYETKTRGERVVHSARPMGEGVYAITTHQGHSHLAYAISLPKEPQEAQKAFNVEKQASIIMSVKNPNKPSPSNAGLSGKQKAAYPDHLQKAFGDRRFVMMDTSEFLNYENAELVLVGATTDVKGELGKVGKELEEMEKQDEEEIEYKGVDKAIFDNLHLKAKEHPIEPLSGDWA